MHFSFPTQPKQRGFTLIEVMSVVAIIAIVSGIIIFGLANQRIDLDLERAAREVTASLREVQNNALTGKTQTPDQIVCYSGLFQTASGTGQYMYYLSTKDSSGACQTPTSILTKNLEGGVILTGTPLNAFFRLPHAQVEKWGGGSSFSPYISTQLITLTKASRSRHLCLYRSGRVSDIGTTASCP